MNDFAFCADAVRTLFHVPGCAKQIQIEWFTSEPADKEVSVVRVAATFSSWGWSSSMRGPVDGTVLFEQARVLNDLFPNARRNQIHELFLRCYYRED